VRDKGETLHNAVESQAFLRFQMLQAIAVLMVDSSKLQQA
jgi:hypothetical protein